VIQVEIMSLSERGVQRWLSNKNCTAQILQNIPVTQQKAFVEYSHWQEPHLENMAEKPKYFVPVSIMDSFQCIYTRRLMQYSALP